MIFEKLCDKSVYIFPVALPLFDHIHPRQLWLVTVCLWDAVARALYPDWDVAEKLAHELGLEDAGAVNIVDSED